MMNIFRKLLFPFSIIYALLLHVRHFLYDYKIINSYSFPIPIINIGNVQLGGTGKTPLVEYLIQLLEKNKFKTATISRGYKRRSQGFLLVEESSLFNEVGDEPLHIKKNNPKSIVAVCENRLEAIDKLSAHKLDAFLLDDAFQHRKLIAGFNIVMTSFNKLFVDDSLFPVGTLRDVKKRAYKSDVIIVNKCPDNITETEKKIIQRKLNHNKIYFSSIFYKEPISLYDNAVSLSLEDYTSALVITGIAQEENFIKFISSKIKKVKHLKFPNHHFFSNKDIVEINEEFKKINSQKKTIITTEKDAIRLNKFKQEFNNINVLVVPIKLTFADKNFDKLILDYVTKTK